MVINRKVENKVVLIKLLFLVSSYFAIIHQDKIKSICK